MRPVGVNTDKTVSNVIYLHEETNHCCCKDDVSEDNINWHCNHR